jgi:type I restriction enzyme R subunit
MLDGMLTKDRLLDLVENFILFDDSKPGGTRKIVARNHQVLSGEEKVSETFLALGFPSQASTLRLMIY